jgi:hypothetical protein
VPDCQSIVLILPYFGTLPSYADLFFRSCAANPTINWLVVTDQQMDAAQLPPNVAIKRTTFRALKDLIDERMAFQTTLPTPYKLCDFKPAYGVIFADDISGYDFWGHCDMDVIFGDLRQFLTRDILDKYNKVLIHGHLSLYRNCHEANHYFERDAPGVNFRDVFASPKSRAFDEFGGMRILLNYHGIPFFRSDPYVADIDPDVYQLRTIGPPNYRHQCFFWQQGKLFKAFWNGDAPDKREYMYIHLQKRGMGRPADDLPGALGWYITPRGFAPKRSDPATPSEMDELNPKNMLFDSKRFVLSSLSRFQRTISQKVDPWPRRV